jgi:hypothetical protein
MKFGNQKLFDYGLLEDQVPLFSRIDANLVLGLKQDQNSGLVMDDLNRLSGRVTHFGDGGIKKLQTASSSNENRYYNVKLPPASKNEVNEKLNLTKVSLKTRMKLKKVFQTTHKKSLFLLLLHSI